METEPLFERLAKPKDAPPSDYEAGIQARRRFSADTDILASMSSEIL